MLLSCERYASAVAGTRRLRAIRLQALVRIPAKKVIDAMSEVA